MQEIFDCDVQNDGLNVKQDTLRKLRDVVMVINNIVWFTILY